MRLGNSKRKLDVDAVRDGVERECPLRAGLTVRILPAADFNPRYRKAVQTFVFDVEDRIEVDSTEDLYAEARLRIAERMNNAEFLVRAIIADLGPIFDDQGNEIEYTEDVGRELFASGEHDDVVGWIGSEARRVADFYAEGVEADAGNSKRGSSGTKAGAAKSAKRKGSKGS